MAKTCIEIGCSDFNNLGHLSDYNWDVFLVEPVPKYATSLRSHFPDAVVVEAAISNVNSILEMSVLNSPSSEEWIRGISHLNVKESSGLVRKNAQLGVGEIELIKVRSLTLDTLIEEQKITRIDYMQVDVEGHEMVILENYSWRIKPAYMKIEHKFIDDKKLQRLLQEKGYHVNVERDDVYAFLL